MRIFNQPWDGRKQDDAGELLCKALPFDKLQIAVAFVRRSGVSHLRPALNAFIPSCACFLVVALAGCREAPQTGLGAKSPFTLTLTATYDQTDKVRIEEKWQEKRTDGKPPPIKERRYTMTLSSDGVRSFQRLDPADGSPQDRTTYIFDGRNQIVVRGTPADANAPRDAIVQSRYASLTNPLRPMLEFGGVPVAELLNTARVKRVGVEPSSDFGPVEIYKADFGNDIAVHFTGEFRLTQRTPRLIVAATENSVYTNHAFRNEFMCKNLRTAGGVSLPEISDVTTYQSPDMTTPVGTAHFVLKTLSDKPLPEENFRVKLPPGSRLTDPTNGNIWRVGENGALSFDRNAGN